MGSSTVNGVPSSLEGLWVIVDDWQVIGTGGGGKKKDEVSEAAAVIRREIGTQHEIR
jgi:hypothetical protein